MKFGIRASGLSAIGLAAVVGWSTVPALSQEISESHQKAAREAVVALHSTDNFDAILPNAAASLKSQLIQKNPDLESVIISTVDEKALAMASRRADLEREAALAFARVYSEDELNQIKTFFASPAGQKLISDGPIVNREVVKAADIWQRGIARDLAQEVGKSIADATPNNPAPAPQATPDGSQPAANN